VTTTIELPKHARAEAIASIYNHAIADAQERMQQRVLDLSGELFADEFQYWPRLMAKRKARR
jgi:hypothetical protein